MALEMRKQCEKCRVNLGTEAVAFMCSHECTFCERCTAEMANICPNCSGELVRRPRRAPQPAAGFIPRVLGDHSAPRASWKLIVGIWTVYGLAASLQQYMYAVMQGQSVTVWYGLALQLPQAWYWASMTPVVFWLGRRLPLRGPGWPARVVAHLFIGAGVVFVLHLLFAFYAPLVAPGITGSGPLIVRAGRMFSVWFVGDGLLYWGVLALGYALEEASVARAREVQESKLQGQLALARLAALKMQLHPHFLFNALHTVGALVRTGRSAPAVQVVARLGDLLRRMLDGAMTQEVALGEELEFIRAYLEIEQVRFEDRLVIRWDVQAAVLNAKVPHLILQPLVENALRHGIASNEAPGLLEIEARRHDDALEVTVTDNGPGLDARKLGDAMRGVGLVNTQLRLTQLYGSNASVEVANARAGGVTACLRVPFEVMPAAVA